MSISRRGFVVAGMTALCGSGCEGRSFRKARQWWGVSTSLVMDEPLTAPRAEAIDDASHVLARLTYGARPGEHARVSAVGAKAFVEEQLEPAALDDWECDRLMRHGFSELEDPRGHFFGRGGYRGDPLREFFPDLKDAAGGIGELYEWKEKALLGSLTRATLLRSVYSRRQLAEVMVNFWTDHFNIDPSKAECKWLKAADDRDVIRAHALSEFPALLRASALSPAMLWYLDGRSNRVRSRAEKPNENYARELLELHTLGIHGGYTQGDVMEVARCLTGWTVRDRKSFFRGRVEFHSGEHDNGPKRVLGHEIAAGGGAKDLDDVLQIVGMHPSTARYIAGKLCRRFIADAPPQAAVTAAAKTFLATSGSIRATLKTIFESTEFWAESVRGAKFKRPMHFVVSALRAANARTDAGPALVDYLLRLGHAPFRYPTPDGYPEESVHWMSSLLWRWNFAVALAGNRIAGTVVDNEGLRTKLGGDLELMATCFGRAATEPERRAHAVSGGGLSLVFAAPAFQRC
jgi:uncharacterized protein (DUF1800 family)